MLDFDKNKGAIKTMMRDLIQSNDGDSAAQAEAVLLGVAWIFKELASDKDLHPLQRKFCNQVYVGIALDAGVKL